MISDRDIACCLAKAILPMIEGYLKAMGPRKLGRKVSCSEAYEFVDKATPRFVNFILEVNNQSDQDLSKALTEEVRKAMLISLRKIWKSDLNY